VIDTDGLSNHVEATTDEIDSAIESAREAIHNPREFEEIREGLDPEEREAFDHLLAEIEPEGSS